MTDKRRPEVWQMNGAINSSAMKPKPAGSITAPSNQIKP